MNNNPKRLPIRPSPRDDESLVSYIYRLAYANYYDDVSIVYDLLGIDINKIRTHGFQLGNEKIDTSILSGITGIDQIVFDSLSLNIKNSNSVIQNTIDQFVIRNIKKQFCPLCLKESIYYREIWDINIYTRCHIHNCLLMCRCIQCNRHLTNQDILRGLCKCGYLISGNLIVGCDNSHLAQLISSKIKKSGMGNRITYIIAEEFEKLEIDLILFLIIFLSIKISHGFYNRRIAFTESSDVHYNDKVVNEAFGIFTNWPQSFYNFLNEFREIPKKDQLLNGIKKDFGRFHYEIKKLSQIPSFRFITDEYQNYLQYIWDGRAELRDFKANVSNGYITESQASQLLGMKKSSIDFELLISSGLIAGEIICKPSKNIILIDKQSLDYYIQQNPRFNKDKLEADIAMKQGYINISDAAEILQISIRSVLKITRENRVKRGHSYYIKKDFIVMLEELIIHRSKVFNNELSLILLYQSQKYFNRVTKGTLIDYYKFLFKSAIQVYIKPGKLGLNKLYFDKQQLTQAIESFVYLEKEVT
ncbi:hypothetical protein ASG89_18070 [Paenibacillus sp. Soil766]|uniref:TniQ family protein n=1 Tax=Paenibacillus sp. Soil766 TaxID=1736404 RepID=UPI00070D230C|nr:TniQ family protein [Paenibacillus sp. Soil766]KRF06768.1 hypothetical protein ASG89_18070 [Paenibacillus sp. Soil766]